MPDNEPILNKSLDEDIIDGYCLATDRTGVPQLQECTARRLDNIGHFALLTDEEPSEPSHTVYAIMTLGDTFFRHRYPALLRLRDQVKRVIQNKHMEIAYLEIHLGMVEDTLELEKPQAQAKEKES